MIKNLCSICLIALLISCGNTNDPSNAVVDELTESSEAVETTNEKKQLVKEIEDFQNDLEDQRVDKIPDYLDSPKRIEEIELNTQNSIIRNAVESNSSRLSSDVIKEQFDLVYTELDLNILNEALKAIPKNDLLANDQATTSVKIGDCVYQIDVIMKELEVKFNIKSTTNTENCKKDQQWKFKSNGEYLVLDRRYYL